MIRAVLSSDRRERRAQSGEEAAQMLRGLVPRGLSGRPELLPGGRR